MRKRLRVIVALSIASIGTSLAGVAMAAQIYVDASNDSGVEDGTPAFPYDTVQEGINAGVMGDEVIVAAGVYNEPVVMADGISVLGAGAGKAILDGTGVENSVVTFVDVRESPVLSGFTIRAGKGDRLGTFGDDPIFGGGGIKIIHSNPIIEYNVITGNVVDEGICLGAGIYVLVTANTPQIRNNYIHGNVALSTTLPDNGQGGGLYIETKNGAAIVSRNRIESNASAEGGGAYIENTGGSTVQFERNIVQGNVATYGGGLFLQDVDNSATSVVNNLFRANGTDAAGGMGGGVMAHDLGTGAFTIANNTFVENSVPLGNGAALALDDTTTIAPDSNVANNIFSGNIGTSGGGIDHTAYSATIQTCDFHNNTGGDLFDGGGSSATLIGNLFVDPGFSAPGEGDFRLLPTSPLIDAAHEASAPAEDQQGFARPFDGDNDLSAVSDLGAFEYPSGEISGLVFVDGTSLNWNVLPLQNSFHLYRGSLSRVILSGEYTQDPMVEPLAATFCGILPSELPFSDPFTAPGSAILVYLVTLTDGTWEGGLGSAPTGLPRRNLNPCP